MVEFAGYDMPVQYSSVISEAQSVRNSAGMFDVSHMARLNISGARVVEFIELVSANDASKLQDKQGQYSVLCNPSGGCIDDIIVYKLSDKEFSIVVNASNHLNDLNWLNSTNKFNLHLTDETTSTYMIAVQGPNAVAKVASLSSQPDLLTNLRPFETATVTIAGHETFVARSGYTGEDGFELIGNADNATFIWKTLLELEVMPCGLAARDTLRVEAGLPLYGHELSDDRSPLTAGIGWAISKTKKFIGSDAIASVRENGASEKLIGIKFGAKRLALPQSGVFVSGSKVGEVSSGVYSPTLECGIAFAFVDSSVSINQPCEVNLRGKLEPATIVSKRFYVRKVGNSG